MILITVPTHMHTFFKPQSVEHIRKLLWQLRLAVISRKSADSCRSNKHFQFTCDARCVPVCASVCFELRSGAAGIPTWNKVMWPG
ncbi:uncharacterized protein Dana_GF27486 [Drosophila ananassae]|uniref:Uncharacterized protein n=1 Tax=Drosophila ananassae TaxID=7217 RepID=A0A0P9AGG7_DROAN|nr:uncharacterized protein Dana_GF27486 [Drosophila ananassae]